MFLFFCRWNLAPHPLPRACQGDSTEWIHSKGSGLRLLLGWTFPELGSAAGSMHQKISNFSSQLWPVFHTDYYHPHAQHPHVSICQSDICTSTISVSKDSIGVNTESKWGILWISRPVKSRFYYTFCSDVFDAEVHYNIINAQIYHFYFSFANQSHLKSKSFIWHIFLFVKLLLCLCLCWILAETKTNKTSPSPILKPCLKVKW